MTISTGGSSHIRHRPILTIACIGGTLLILGRFRSKIRPPATIRVLTPGGGSCAAATGQGALGRVYAIKQNRTAPHVVSVYDAIGEAETFMWCCAGREGLRAWSVSFISIGHKYSVATL